MTLKKIVSIGAAMLIAVGGSLVATKPASAAPLAVTTSSQTSVLGGTVRVVATFPASVTDNGTTYELDPATRQMNGSQTYGAPMAEIRHCTTGENPSNFELANGFSSTCTDGAPWDATITNVSTVGSVSPDNLVITTDFSVGNNAAYIGRNMQLIVKANYIDTAQGMMMLTSYAAIKVQIVASISGISATANSSTTATMTYSTTYAARIAYIYRATASNSTPATASALSTAAQTGNSNWSNASGSSASTLPLSGLQPSTAYAVDFVLLSSSDNVTPVSTVYTATFTTQAPPATTPGVILNPSATAGDGEVTLTWTAPVSDGGSAITGYTIEYAANPNGFNLSTTSNTTSKAITGLTNGTNYWFRIKATNAVGSGSATSVANYYTPTAPLVQPSTYTLTFDLQGGTITGTNTTFTGYSSGASVNISQRLTAYSPVRSGYTFSGWYSMAVGGVQLSTVTITADTTVFAQWTAQLQQQQSNYRVTLNANGGSIGTTTFVDQTTSGELLYLPNPGNAGAAPTRNGYTLSGWSTNMAASVGSYTTTPTSNATYYAIWTSNSVNNNANPVSVSQNPATPTYANGVFTSTNASWVNPTNSKRAYWLICETSHAAANGNQSSSRPTDCVPFVNEATSSSVINWLATNPLTLQSTVHRRVAVCGQNGCSTEPVVTSGKYLVWYEIDNGIWTISATIPVGGSTSTDSTDVVDVPITEDMRPLPVWASNIVASIPTLTKSLVTTGGSVSLTGGDYADLKSVTIGGKAVAFKIETTGNVSIPVPAGEAGKTADIVVVFGGGVLTVQDAIKYVAPFNVAKIGERPIAIGAGAKKITEAVADQIRQAAFANMNNNTISCVAYAANNTAAAKAAAKLTAVQACGIATKANPGLKAAEVTVIVNKTKAKKEAVGIKVYKATN